MIAFELRLGRGDSAARRPLLRQMAQAPTAHVPPQNIDAEESVLGAMLVAERALSRVIDEVKLKPEDFYLDKHRLIFGTVHDLYAASKPVDELTVAEAIREARDLRVDRKRIKLEEPIHQTGTYMIEIELPGGMAASVKTIVAEEK